MSRRRIDVGVTYFERPTMEPWEETDFFCPSCAAKAVWACRDGGDHYEGERYLCIHCGAAWNWPVEPRVSDAPTDRQVLLAIRAQEPRA